MAATDEKVMRLVERELLKAPGASVGDLFEKAKKASRAIGSLSLRQFHARYPLQVKRRANKAGGRGRPTAKKVAKAKAAPRRAKAAPKRTKAVPRRVVRRVARKVAAPAANRDAVRNVFLNFATDLAGADGTKNVVKVVAGVDRYVDQVIKAVGA